MFHTSHSTATRQHLPKGKHTSSSSHGLYHCSQPSMDSSHFYDVSSAGEQPAWDDCSDISFNPWAKSKRSSLREAGNRISLTSFRLSDQSPSWQSSAVAGEMLSPLEVKPAPVKNPKKLARTSAPILPRNEQFQENSSRALEEGLQDYMQTLLGGSITEDVHQEMDLYQECLGRRNVHQSRFLSPPASKKRASYNQGRKRMSIMSTASDISVVPSLVFSDVDVQAPRPSNLSVNTHPRATAFHRNSMISLTSIDSVASNRSWFMDDESPPESPVELTLLKKRASFTRGVGMGMSCFDDGDDDDDEEEEEKEKILSPESPPFALVGAGTRKKQSPGLSIETKVPRNPPNMLSPSLPPLTHSPISPRSSICASPNKRRSRRRTASSECIVLEALEKMNAVMYELANEDINRKSVVGIDLPGNQVSVDAYGELWW
ncbi:hypothetical protein L211DRAFT_285974 [Terfezia boudieri ATCC MYA-4762]|uniref:Uncharacterized protein n=1 Tax=Terfezia boudieri ATCC MYA-4762 TaxID=1051890 RepID=A0A3N4LNV8_9PEZI|nr:hypothetical protein L211DRAFT_285974 [Terfezia boudieri ATCC MYA-4762]